MLVHIYDKHTEQNAFDTNGIAIINPKSATLTEELNGRYDYEITAVCDPNDDSWRALKVYNIIKSPSTGQLFMIYKVKYTSQGGYPSVTAYADTSAKILFSSVFSIALWFIVFLVRYNTPRL
jgi:hypothetical protein